MSWLSGSSELVSGGWLSSAYPGLGATGLSIKTAGATGEHGVGVGINDGLLDASEYLFEVVTQPAGGVVSLDELGRATIAVPADGSYTWTYRLREDGVYQSGTTTVAMRVGIAEVAVSATIFDAGDDAVSASAVAVPLGSVLVSAAAVDSGSDEVSVAATVSGQAGALSDAEMRQLFVWVSDLARVHGLVIGEPLVVTPTQRTAGAVTQTISESGQTVTVTRY